MKGGSNGFVFLIDVVRDVKQAFGYADSAGGRHLVKSDKFGNGMSMSCNDDLFFGAGLQFRDQSRQMCFCFKDLDNLHCFCGKPRRLVRGG